MSTTKALALTSLLLCAGNLQANRLPLTLISIGELLAGMPKRLASPHDPRGVLAQREQLPYYTEMLRGVMRAFISPQVLEDVRTAPFKQVMRTLELASAVSQQAEMLSMHIPGLHRQPPFSYFNGVMRHTLREAGASEYKIIEQLPYGQ